MMRKFEKEFVLDVRFTKIAGESPGLQLWDESMHSTKTLYTIQTYNLLAWQQIDGQEAIPRSII